MLFQRGSTAGEISCRVATACAETDHRAVALAVSGRQIGTDQIDPLDPKRLDRIQFACVRFHEDSGPTRDTPNISAGFLVVKTEIPDDLRARWIGCADVMSPWTSPCG